MTHGNDETNWYCIPLTSEQIEFGFVDIIRGELEEIWISRGALEGFTIWLKEDPAFTEIYFSPIAAEAAKLLLYRFSGAPCKKPQLESLSFVLGHAFCDDTPTDEISS